MSNEEKINMLLDTDFNKCELVINRIYKEQYVKDLEQQNKLYKSVLDEIREQLKLERKLALSLNKPYTISVIDKLLDKVKQ